MDHDEDLPQGDFPENDSSSCNSEDTCDILIEDASFNSESASGPTGTENLHDQLAVIRDSAYTFSRFTQRP